MHDYNFRGWGVRVWHLQTLLPHEQLLPLPTPYCKMFLERSLNDLHHPSSSIFNCYSPPHPPPMPPINKKFYHTHGGVILTYPDKCNWQLLKYFYFNFSIKLDGLQLDVEGLLCKTNQELLLQICKVLLIPDETIKGLKTRKPLISAVRNRIEEDVTIKSSEAALTTLVNLNKIPIETLVTSTLEGDGDKVAVKKSLSVVK